MKAEAGPVGCREGSACSVTGRCWGSESRDRMRAVTLAAGGSGCTGVSRLLPARNNDPETSSAKRP